MRGFEKARSQNLPIVDSVVFDYYRRNTDFIGAECESKQDAPASSNELITSYSRNSEVESFVINTIMRELIIANTKSPIFDIQQNKQHKFRSIEKLLKISEVCFSIELCPNRFLDAESLSQIQNRFVSVTWHNPYGSDLNDVKKIPAISFVEKLHFQGYNVLLHLAGRNLSKYQMVKILDVVKSLGVRNIFALQGDPSQITKQNVEYCDFPYAADLVEFIRTHYGEFFTIGVAGYPEKHPESDCIEADIAHLKQKVDKGANFIITQASYSYQAFDKFAKLCRDIDISVPIIPGIFIISSLKTLTAMSNFCGVPVARDIMDIVERNALNKTAVENFGIFHATELIKKILSSGEFCGFHAFSLNNFVLQKKVLKRLGFHGIHIERPFSHRRSSKVGILNRCIISKTI